MKTASEYQLQLQSLGLSKMEFRATTISEAKEELKRVQDIQGKLRQIKKEINTDLKEIRAHYRQQSSNAASKSSTVVEIFGKRKLAGQMRADAKRQLRYNRDQIIQPYENIKLTIDDLLTQLNSAKGQINSFIGEIKAEEQAKKEATEAITEKLRTIHLETTPPNSKYQFKAKIFSIPAPLAPPRELIYSAKKPVPPIFKKAGIRGKFNRKHRKQIENKNLVILEEYERELTLWEERRKKAEEIFHNDHLAYKTRLEEWKAEKEIFEQEEQKRIQYLENERLSNPEIMSSLLSEHLSKIHWPTTISYNIEISETKDSVFIKLKFPEIEDWPVQTKSAAQIRRDYLTHIHSIAFRIIGETFFMLPGIQQVVLSGFVMKPSKTTGQLQQEYLISTKVWRAGWEKLNFNQLDWINVIACFDEFETRRNYTKTAIIKPIEPF